MKGGLQPALRFASESLHSAVEIYVTKQGLKVLGSFLGVAEGRRKGGGLGAS